MNIVVSAHSGRLSAANIGATEIQAKMKSLRHRFSWWMSSKRTRERLRPGLAMALNRKPAFLDKLQSWIKGASQCHQSDMENRMSFYRMVLTDFDHLVESGLWQPAEALVMEKMELLL